MKVPINDALGFEEYNGLDRSESFFIHGLLKAREV